MLTLRKELNRVVLTYSPDSPVDWIYDRLKKFDELTLKKTFILTYDELISEEDREATEVEFAIAIRDGDYYRFPEEILGLNYPLYLHESLPLNRKTFIAERRISIFSKIDRLIDAPIFIGGDEPTAIPIADFERLIKNFPNSTELDKYSAARVSAIIASYMETRKDYKQDYETYVNKKPSLVGQNLEKVLAESEVAKYELLLKKISDMLESEKSYNEKQWQKEISQIVRLLYPKYIHVFENAPVRDPYKKKKRFIDMLLVDSSGNTDILEIKKPFEQSIVTKQVYRDNHVPLRELSGSVMQVEKYIFYLSKGGRKAEEILSSKYREFLADGFEIRITNPGGLIILGRDKDLTDNQRQDFEIIKRKYKNVVDIISYDDLISRLKFTISRWKGERK